MLRVNAKVKDANKRADVFVAENLPQFTRSSLRRLFDNNLVLLDGKPVKASHKLRLSDNLEVDTTLLATQPNDVKLPIIYEDKDVIVLDKPAGVLTHSKGVLNTEATVASFISHKLNDKKLAGNRAGIVHRLDRATSGVIVAAKNEKVSKWLQKQFSTRKAKKIYSAIVEGVPVPAQAIIDAPIERNPQKPQMFRVGAGGKPAQTKYKVIKKLDWLSNAYSLLELQPLTGRTHQLRIHLKYIDHPIVGDHLYGQGGDHMYLHAKSLELTLPGERKMQFEAPEPSYFVDFAKS